MTIPEVGKSLSCFQDVSSGAVSIIVSRKFNLVLMMSELTTGLDIDSRDSTVHMGENKLFTQNQMIDCWVRLRIWDPGIATTQV